MQKLPENPENSKPAQDPADGPKLLEQAARAIAMPLTLEELSDVKWGKRKKWIWARLTDDQKEYRIMQAHAAIQALLPHLSEESRARLEKELSGE